MAETVFWDVFEDGENQILMAATETGLVEVSLGHESFDEFAAQVRKHVPGAELVHASEKLSEAKRQLSDYFSGNLQSFDLPLDLRGTEFQLKVWNAMLEIPYGHTWSYLDIARFVGNEAAVRAVGGACGKNPVPVIVPCHRVIGKNGKLTGFTGGMHWKERMLQLEGVSLV